MCSVTCGGIHTHTQADQYPYMKWHAFSPACNHVCTTSSCTRKNAHTHTHTRTQARTHARTCARKCERIGKHFLGQVRGQEGARMRKQFACTHDRTHKQTHPRVHLRPPICAQSDEHAPARARQHERVQSVTIADHHSLRPEDLWLCIGMSKCMNAGAHRFVR